MRFNNAVVLSKLPAPSVSFTEKLIVTYVGFGPSVKVTDVRGKIS